MTDAQSFAASRRILVWTEENIEKLRALRSEGLNFSTIAARLGTTKNSVIGKARRLQFEQHTSKPFNWDNNNIQRLRALCAERGYSYREIAEILGTTPSSVSKRIRKLGWRLYLKADPYNPRQYTKKTPQEFKRAIEEYHDKIEARAVKAPEDCHPVDIISVAECRWPVTAEPPHLFCNNKRLGLSSYCYFHYRISEGGVW